MLSNLCLPLVGIALLAIYQIYRFIIRPKSQLSFYKKQGLPVIFAPLRGYLKQASIDLQVNKDLLHTWKQLNYLNPKPRAFASNLGPFPVVALKDPELIKQLYLNQERYYIKAPPAVAFPKLILRNATIVAEGESWKHHRKLSAPLYSYDNLRERVPEIVQIVNERFEKLKQKDLKQLNFMTEVQHILLEVTGKIFLGIDLSTLEFKGKTVSAFVCELIDRAGSETFDAFTLIFGTDIAQKGFLSHQKSFVKDAQDLRAFLFGAAKARLGEILAAKETSDDKKPLLLQLLFEQKQKLNIDELTEVDLVDEFANFAMGAMDTTSHVINYASYFILQNSASHKKLAHEVDHAFHHTSSVTLDSLNQMDYTSAIIKETMRLAAPLPNLLPRVAVEDNQLGDLKIKAGTVVVIAAVTNSFDPDYHDEPEKFEPERWIDENSRTRKSLSKNAYLYIPFSTGARTCPGQHLGTNLARIVLSLFVKHFNYSHSDKNYEMIHSAKFFSEPHHALTYNLEPRC